MRAAASSGPRDIQGDRDSRARVKMRAKLRRRGEGKDKSLAALKKPQLIELMRETHETGEYSARLRGAYHANRPQWVEVSEKYFFYTLNALPPAEQRSLGHIMGSPYAHNDSGKSLWFCLLQVSDRHRQTRYVGKICTRAEWVKAYHSATWEDCMGIQARTCDECNGSGVDTSHSYPEPCPVCNGKRKLWPDLRTARSRNPI